MSSFEPKAVLAAPRSVPRAFGVLREMTQSPRNEIADQSVHPERSFQQDMSRKTPTIMRPSAANFALIALVATFSLMYLLPPLSILRGKNGERSMCKVVIASLLVMALVYAMCVFGA
jgi:hypothetical protein